MNDPKVRSARLSGERKRETNKGKEEKSKGQTEEEVGENDRGRRRQRKKGRSRRCRRGDRRTSALLVTYEDSGPPRLLVGGVQRVHNLDEGADQNHILGRFAEVP